VDSPHLYHHHRCFVFSVGIASGDRLKIMHRKKHRGLLSLICQVIEKNNPHQSGLLVSMSGNIEAVRLVHENDELVIIISAAGIHVREHRGSQILT